MSTTTTLTPWHQAVSLRDDVRSGEQSLAIFAADLYKVVMGEGSKVYRDPYEFFALTYPTVNLRNLCKEVVLRLAGKTDKAIRQLELTYGGGKTHTLITLYHLTRRPDLLKDLSLPAVKQFTEYIQIEIPRAHVVIMPFDKFDSDIGLKTKGPNGEERTLKYPWSVLAYQLDGDNGLRALHVDGLAEERETPPAEPLLADLLALPQRKNEATLLLIDEVLMYARRMADKDSRWRYRLVDFFQYLTQAVTKVNTCAMVASLLATDPLKNMGVGREITQELAAIFRRETEGSVQPVEKEDIAEVLRRRFFTPDSIANKENFRPFVAAAYQGIANLDEQVARRTREFEDRLLNSFPFHPDLTEVLYGKWTNLEGFQRTRGVLRDFALALQDAAKWDDSPLISTNVFIGDPARRGLSDAARELTSTASHEQYEGKHYEWSGVVEGELEKARQIQTEFTGLRHRELEQIAFGTFLHSQPLGAEASLRDLYLLVGHTRPDRIELNKALKEWIEVSWYLDEKNIQVAGFNKDGERQLPDKWRLGPEANLTHMHHDATLNITKSLVDAHLLEEIDKCSSLTSGVQAAGARPHKLPKGVTYVDDNTEFHYVVLGPRAASMVNAPSEEAVHYIEDAGPDKPRVSKNFILVVTPSKDMLEAARVEIQKYLGWVEVERQLKGQDVDAARLALLKESKSKSAQSVANLVRQMYNIVVTRNEEGEIEAFRLPGNEGPLFDAIKAASQSRIKLDQVSAEALLPGSPYDLWKEGDRAHPLSYLLTAFAKYPRLPKLLKIDPIEQTIFQGCQDGVFVLRIAKTGTTYWRQSVVGLSAATIKDLEVVLPEYADLSEIQPDLLLPGKLPALWDGDRLSLKTLYDYFAGGYVATVYNEQYLYDDVYAIPRAAREVVNTAVKVVIRSRKLWLVAGEASLYGEDVPEEILTDSAILRRPPDPLHMDQVMPAQLPDAWQEEVTTADLIASTLAKKLGEPLPWTVVRTVLDHAFATRTLDRTKDSGEWPCDVAGAKAVKIAVMKKETDRTETPVEPVKTGGSRSTEVREEGRTLDRKMVASAALDAMEVQNLGRKVAELKKLTVGRDLRITVSISFDGKNMSAESLGEVKALLAEISPGLVLD